jgi:hypothetical protein
MLPLHPATTVASPHHRWPCHLAATLGGQGLARIQAHRSKGRKASPVSPSSHAYRAMASPCVVTTQARPRHHVRVAVRLVQPFVERPTGAHALEHTNTRTLGVPHRIWVLPHQISVRGRAADPWVRLASEKRGRSAIGPSRVLARRAASQAGLLASLPSQPMSQAKTELGR